MTKTKTTLVHFRCPTDLLRAMKKLAKRDGDTLTEKILSPLRSVYGARDIPSVAPPPFVDNPK